MKFEFLKVNALRQNFSCFSHSKLMMNRRWRLHRDSSTNPNEFFCLEWMGCGSPGTFHELRWLLVAVSPSLIFCSETRIRKSRCNNWRSILGYKELFLVKPEGKKWGFMLLFHADYQVQIYSYSQGHIDCRVEHDGKVWRFTGFHGNPDKGHRNRSWELLRRLHNSHIGQNTTWLVGGDFNEILYDSEK